MMMSDDANDGSRVPARFQSKEHGKKSNFPYGGDLPSALVEEINAKWISQVTCS